ncbi:MAG: hypothetical protein R2865_14245 [Deinococcales bacterium]
MVITAFVIFPVDVFLILELNRNELLNGATQTTLASDHLLVSNMKLDYVDFGFPYPSDPSITP